MCSHVGFEVGALGVGFPAAGELAVVRRGAFSGPRPAASLLFSDPYVVLCVKLQQRWRRGRGEHHPLHRRRVMLLVNADRLSVHAVLSLKLWQTVCVLLLVGRVHVLVLEMVLIRIIRAHRVDLRQMAVCASMRSRVLHGVRTETWQRTWNCSLVVRKSCWLHGAHLVSLVHLSHKVPTTSSHHARLTYRLGFNFVSKRWGRCGHLVMSWSSWNGDRIQRLQFGVLPPVSRFACAVRRTVPRVTNFWREKLRHEAADWTRAREARGAVVALCGQARRWVVAAVWHRTAAATLR